MNLPDPKNYQDGVLYFHDTHKLVLHECSELEGLLADAESRGVFQSFGFRPEWEEVLNFFRKAAPHHEREEETLLFPMVAVHVPRVGFQQPNSTFRFLVDGHDALERSMKVLEHDWEVFCNKPRTANELDAAHDMHSEEDARFVSTGRELVALYREHIALEETRVYAIAEKLLSGAEKLQLMDLIRASNGDDAITTILNYEEPQFSDSTYNIIYSPTEAVAEEDSGLYEEEDDEDDQMEL